jgi:hypothetical protein
MLLDRPKSDEEYYKLLVQELLGVMAGLLGEDIETAIKCRRLAIEFVERAHKGEFA